MSVEALQSVGGGNPEIALLILRNAVDLVRKQSVGSGVMCEKITLHLLRKGCCCHKAKNNNGESRFSHLHNLLSNVMNSACTPARFIQRFAQFIPLFVQFTAGQYLKVVLALRFSVFFAVICTSSIHPLLLLFHACRHLLPLCRKPS